MNLLKAFEVIGGISNCVTLFDWARSAISSSRTQSNGMQEQIPQEDVLVPLRSDNGRQEQILQDDVLLQLQSDLKGLEDKLLEAYDLIDRAEWRSHRKSVAKLLPILKDLTYDAEDLLDEFRWYDMKVRVEGEAIQLSPLVEFFHSIVHGSFNKVTDIQKRIGNVSSLLERMGRLHEVTPRFDKTLRPVTTSFCTEPKIFGRQNELKEVISLLGVPNHSSSSSAKRKRTSNAANNKLTTSSVPVLPIVGIGGVGKTTLAQEITTNQRVKSHFDRIIWICVSDEFDEERFTKILIKSLSGREPRSDNLDDLQRHLVKEVVKKRFLLILDDIWPAGLEDEERWKKFCAPLKNVLQGSMLLVTTRFAEVADTVGTMKSFALEGLEDGVFWNFFKLCVFGAEDSEIDPELEQIGRSILPKLKGTPLAAKTIGRLLRKSLNTAHWNNILNNELWQIDQKETDILPALRLSYMYLPFYLKRCFSFCAVYPKDYNFDKDTLAEIWVAEGFVEPRGSNALQHIGCEYFEDLVNLSFFQEHRGHYVIHDLMHDMAQLVSKEECFILKNESDLKNIPENVRHLSILKSSIKTSSLRILCKYKKLRTLLCDKGLKGNTPDSMIEQWFSELRSLRVIRCASINELPESIGNLKHLRYLQICRGGNFYRFPSSFCTLYNLQILYARQCEFRTLPSGVSKLINLQKFESSVLEMEVDAVKWEEGIRFIENFIQNRGHLVLCNLGAISKDRAAEMELRKRRYLNTVTLRWSSTRCSEHNEIEVCQALHPPVSVKSVHLDGYPGKHLPSWFPGSSGSEDMSFPDIPAVTADNNNGAVFSSLKEVSIKGCQNLTSLELLLRPAYVPAIRNIKIEDCASVRSVGINSVGDSTSLEELKVEGCPNLTHLLAPSLAIMKLYCKQMTSIELQKWSLPALRKLEIHCGSLTSLRESKQISTDRSHGWASNGTGKFPLLTDLSFSFCRKLETLDDLLTQEYLPVIKKISFEHGDLLSLPTERFGGFHFLEDLCIFDCPRLKWQSGIGLLPCSLRKLTLENCGNFSVLIPSCLENLTSLEELKMTSCKGVVCVAGELWSNLKSLQTLMIVNFPDLVSIGGLTAIANIDNVLIKNCWNLKEIEQPIYGRGFSRVWSQSFTIRPPTTV